MDVGPPRAEDFGLRAQVEVTAARNGLARIVYAPR